MRATSFFLNPLHVCLCLVKKERQIMAYLCLIKVTFVVFHLCRLILLVVGTSVLTKKSFELVTYNRFRYVPILLSCILRRLTKTLINLGIKY